MLRAAGAASTLGTVDDGPVGGPGRAPRPGGRRSSPTCPTRRRSWPPAPGDRRQRPVVGRARRPTRRGTRCRTGCSPEMGGRPRGTAAACGSTARAIDGGADLDMSEVGELAPVVAALACAGRLAVATIRGSAHLRGHETDRLAALANELTRLGGDVQETDDGLRSPRGRCTAAPSRPTTTTGWRRPRPCSAWPCPASRSRTSRPPAKTLPGFRPGLVDRLRPGPGGADRRGRDYDEDDVRVRPGRGHSRPRTKDRPGHVDAAEGWVVTVDRGPPHLSSAAASRTARRPGACTSSR